MAAKYGVFSGFLGAGKTTAMIAFAREIKRRGLGNAGILANDLGSGNIVDAEFCMAAGVMTRQINGGCICYQHENLVGKMRQMEDEGADIIFSDIPGCGIGALDHVYLELKEKEAEEFELLPFICIIDPERMRMVMPEQALMNLPEEMKFLLDAQMAEADLLILNKIDTVSDEEKEAICSFIKSIYPDKPLLAVSAMKGDGVAEAVDYILSNRSEAVHREIGYGSEAFMEAEEKMGWYNTRVYLQQREEKNLDFNLVVEHIFEGIRRGLMGKGGNVPHLKMFAADSDEVLTDYLKASLTGVDYDIQFDHRLEKEYSALSLIINARCAADAQLMAEIAADAVEETAEKYNLKVRTFFLESFGMMEEGKNNIAKASRY